MERRNWFLTVATALVALVLAACAPASGSTQPQADPVNADVTISATEFVFDPADLETAGPSFVLALSNDGDAPHDLTVEGTDVKLTAAPGDEVAAKIELEPGTYTIYCSIPGHRESGMEGTLTVAPGPAGDTG